MLALSGAVARYVAVLLAVILCGAVAGLLVGSLLGYQWWLGPILGGCIAAVFVVPAVPRRGERRASPFMPPPPPDIGSLRDVLFEARMPVPRVAPSPGAFLRAGRRSKRAG